MWLYIIIGIIIIFLALSIIKKIVRLMFIAGIIMLIILCTFWYFSAGNINNMIEKANYCNNENDCISRGFQFICSEPYINRNEAAKLDLMTKIAAKIGTLQDDCPRTLRYIPTIQPTCINSTCVPKTCEPYVEYSPPYCRCPEGTSPQMSDDLLMCVNG